MNAMILVFIVQIVVTSSELISSECPDDICPNDAVAQLQLVSVEKSSNPPSRPQSLVQHGNVVQDDPKQKSDAKEESAPSWIIQTVLIAACCILIATVGHEMYIVVHGGLSGIRQSRIIIQTLYIMLSTINCMTISVIIPGSYDLMSKLPEGATMSGAFLGGPYILAPLGVIVCKRFALRDKLRHVRRAISLCLVLTALCALLFLFMLYTTTEVTPSFAWGITAVKSLEGLFQACAFYFISCMAYWFTPPSGVTSLAIASLTSICIGLSLGSLVSSLMMTWQQNSDHLPATERSATAICPMTLLWAVYACAFSLAAPGRLPSDTEEVQEEPTRKHLDVSQITMESRKIMFSLGLLYTLHRALSLSSIEVAASLYFERTFKWSVKAIGFASGAVYAASAILGLLILLCRYRGVLSDAHILNAMIGIAVVGSLLIFDFVGIGFASILVGDVLYYTTAFNANGIIDGWTTISTIPDTNFSLESYQALKTVLISLARGFAPPLARLILDKFGWTFYAYAQLALSLLGFLIGRQMVSLAEGSNVQMK
jgi:hypothetical protein